VLREFEGLTYEEMARVMQCSLGTVMSRLHHARKKLQSKLLKMGVAGGHGV
jgi:RNA polymerase sigma-70 factor, ECF subfamily